MSFYELSRITCCIALHVKSAIVRQLRVILSCDPVVWRTTYSEYTLYCSRHERIADWLLEIWVECVVLFAEGEQYMRVGFGIVYLYGSISTHSRSESHKNWLKITSCYPTNHHLFHHALVSVTFSIQKSYRLIQKSYLVIWKIIIYSIKPWSPSHSRSKSHKYL